MKRQFDKMHGLGNDFVIIDARDNSLSITPKLARAIANRRTGVGCDQLILLEQSAISELKMRIWNADGSEAESCGNATRCVAELTGAKRIETPGGVIEAAVLESEVEAKLPAPKFGWDEIPLAFPTDTNPLPMAWGDLEHPYAVNVGNPHLVFFVDNLGAIALEELGPNIEEDAAFPERINVNVACIDDEGVTLRTWERGAGLTLACGTGACATAVAAIRSRRLNSPIKVSMRGGSLTIGWTEGDAISMRGEATHVFSGTLDFEAFE